MVRNLLAWLAFALRLVVLWTAFSPTFCSRIATDVYWGGRLDQPDYLAFKAIRDEVDRCHDAWARGELSDMDARNSALAFSTQLLAWEERTKNDIGLFEEERLGLYQRCPPFHSYSGRLAMLENEEAPGDGYFVCFYLEFIS